MTPLALNAKEPVLKNARIENSNALIKSDFFYKTAMSERARW